MGGLPFFGGVVTTGIIGPGLSSPNPPAPPAGWDMVGAQTTQLGMDKVTEPLMSYEQALSILLKNKDFKNRYTSELYGEFRRVDTIDPDLQVLKSLSPMAKVTFQRQRNVERALDQQLNGSIWNEFMTQVLEKAINKLKFPTK